MGDDHFLYIGLMSGTSIDGIDAALMRFGDRDWQLMEAIEYTIPNALHQRICQLCQPGNNEIELLGTADRELAEHFAAATKQLLEKSTLTARDITAIGCHGQTVRHRPNQEHAFTLQIGDPNTIAHLTGITTVADFRRKDIAAGGQGAPLAPAFHQAVFSSLEDHRAIINIGGMANISVLANNCRLLGFDTGPGNVLMDEWIRKNQHKQYDHSGDWAGTGQVIPELLKTCLADKYFSEPPPKSTGRELFNLSWLETLLGDNNYQPEDVQATLLELTAQSITNEVNALSTAVNQVYICGGGTYNTQLMSRLSTLLQPKTLDSTVALGIAPEWVEAAAFAWMAKQTINRLPSNTYQATGASENLILGGIYYS